MSFEIDEYGCSTGKISSVQDTCFDFRVGKAIGKDIDANCEQIRFGAGYDHNFILKKCIMMAEEGCRGKKW